MKLIIVAALAIVALAVAAPQNGDKTAAILRSDFDQQPNGPYSYSFETENKIQHQEQSELKKVVDEENKPQEVLVASGSYSYVDPEGKSHSVVYSADENGFHAESEDIPKAA